MQYIDEYRDKEKIISLSNRIKFESRSKLRIMEVCGGHTMAIQRFGIPSLLPEHIDLVSGPGCPVCVTDRAFIDKAIAYARQSDVIITTFGDLIRVPGSSSTLDREKAMGADVRIVYSILDALTIAKKNRKKKIIFLGIGFETTSPGTAAGIIKAQMAGLFNFYVLSAHKTMPPPMAALIEQGVKIDGYLGPGHVSTITGSAMYQFIPERFNLGVVISGFEPLDILQSIYMLVLQHENKQPKVEIQYNRVVRPEGNIKALELLDEVFELRDDWWRGLGILPASGMAIRPKYESFDAEKQIPVQVEPTREDKGCICGQILKGIASPSDCKLFGKACTPADPAGACMVSNEGACAAHYRFKKS